MRILRKFFIFVFLLQSSWIAASQVENLSGKSLEEALRLLQEKGYNILYSSDLVRPEMKVLHEPDADSPRELLRELLTPHGLKVQAGPAKTLMVVPGVLPVSESSTVAEKQMKAHVFVDSPQETIVVPFVTLYVSARDTSGRFVTDLTAGDFTIKENGKEQKILEFSNLENERSPQAADEEPLSVIFLLDGSQSMEKLQSGKRRHEIVKQAAIDLIDGLRSEDSVMIMGFNSTSWTINDLTNDFKVARQNVNASQVVGGRTALFDALAAALEKSRHMPGRRVIVVCSDGEDNISETKFDDLIVALQNSDVTVFAVGTYFDKRVSKESRERLERISEVTGGYAFLSSSAEDLRARMEEVRKAMTSQYSIGYHPPQPTVHGWRDVHVECRLPKVRLRYRKTYLY